jgi:hypothetical protein
MVHNKYTAQQIDEKIKLHSPHISLDYSTYVDNNTSAKFVDSEYGEWHAKPWRVVAKRSQHRRRSGKFGVYKSKTAQEVETIIHDRCDFIHLDVDTFKNCHTKARFVDSMYGEWWATPSEVMNGGVSPVRAGNKRFTPAEVEEKAQCHIPGIKLMYDTFTNTKNIAKFIDPIHGEWMVSPHHVLAGHKHPGNYDNVHYSADALNNRLSKDYPHVWIDSRTYVNMRTKARFVDSNFGEWWAFPCNVIRGHGHPCRYTTNPKSTEQALAKILGLERFNRVPYFLSGKIVIKPDFKISDELYVEANGLYFHSELRIKNKDHHYRRRLVFESFGRRLMQFNEDEIRDKGHIIKSIVNGVIHSPLVINAANCIISDVPPAFFDSSHLRGHAAFSKAIGLYCGNTAVYGVSYRVCKSKLYITRYCPALHSEVVGGLSKLLKYICEANAVNTIICTIDLRFEDSKLLKLLGFQLLRSRIGYRWAGRGFTNSKRSPKFKYRIYDAGQDTFVKTT